MNEATKQSLLSAVRSILIVIGSLLTARGYTDDETVQSMIGAVMVIAPIVWGVVEKVLAEKKTQAREVIAVNAGIMLSNETSAQTPLATQGTTPAIIAAAGPAADPASTATSPVATGASTAINKDKP